MKRILLSLVFVSWPFLSAQAQLRVLVFLDTECPICQKTTQRVQALAKMYPKQVHFEAVYPTETVTRREVDRFERQFAFTLPHHLDPTHRLVRKYDATTTPEVILLSPKNEVLYRGSVDNQFYKLGRYRPEPTEFYLRDAIDATLHNQPVAVRDRQPVGCLINRSTK